MAKFKSEDKLRDVMMMVQENTDQQIETVGEQLDIFVVEVDGDIRN